MKAELPCQGKNDGICYFDKHGALIIKAAIPRDKLLSTALALIKEADMSGLSKILNNEAAKMSSEDFRKLTVMAGFRPDLRIQWLLYELHLTLEALKAGKA